MNSLSSMASSASKAIWGGQEGDQKTENETAGQEPVSGEQGAGTTNEPFDKGNEQPTTSSESKAEESVPPKEPETTTTKTEGSAPSTEPESTTKTDNDSVPPKEQASTSKPSVERNADPDAKPNDGSTEIESHMPKNDQEREELAAKGALPHDPNDHSGEPLHMHDGGESKKEGEEGEEREKLDRSASVAHEGGGEHGKEKGTGEQYVKTTGVAAEGGDFDATKPGAGAEANRLLEEKGVHKEKAADSTNDSTDDVASKDSEPTKTSKMTKLKEKLHIGHKKP